jgi:hypothetical protein
MSEPLQGAGRQLLADLCVLLPLFREEMGTQETEAAIDKVFDCAKRGTDIHGPLVDLVRQFRPSYEATNSTADALAELVMLCGIPYTPGTRTPVPLMGRPGRVLAQVFRCPVDRCDRAWVRRSGDSVPWCALEDQELRERS